MPVLLTNVWSQAGRLGYPPPSSLHLTSRAHDTRLPTPEAMLQPLPNTRENLWSQTIRPGESSPIKSKGRLTNLMCAWHCSFTTIPPPLLRYEVRSLITCLALHWPVPEIRNVTNPWVLTWALLTSRRMQSECFHVGTISPFCRGKFPPEDDRASQMKFSPLKDQWYNGEMERFALKLSGRLWKVRNQWLRSRATSSSPGESNYQPHPDSAEHPFILTIQLPYQTNNLISSCEGTMVWIRHCHGRHRALLQRQQDNSEKEQRQKWGWEQQNKSVTEFHKKTNEVETRPCLF